MIEKWTSTCIIGVSLFFTFFFFFIPFYSFLPPFVLKIFILHAGWDQRRVYSSSSGRVYGLEEASGGSIWRKHPEDAYDVLL